MGRTYRCFFALFLLAQQSTCVSIRRKTLQGTQSRQQEPWRSGSVQSYQLPDVIEVPFAEEGWGGSSSETTARFVPNPFPILDSSRRVSNDDDENTVASSSSRRRSRRRGKAVQKQGEQQEYHSEEEEEEAWPEDPPTLLAKTKGKRKTNKVGRERDLRERLFNDEFDRLEYSSKTMDPMHLAIAVRQMVVPPLSRVMISLYARQRILLEQDGDVEGEYYCEYLRFQSDITRFMGDLKRSLTRSSGRRRSKEETSRLQQQQEEGLDDESRMRELEQMAIEALLRREESRAIVGSIPPPYRRSKRTQRISKETEIKMREVGQYVTNYLQSLGMDIHTMNAVEIERHTRDIPIGSEWTPKIFRGLLSRYMDKVLKLPTANIFLMKRTRTLAYQQERSKSRSSRAAANSEAGEASDSAAQADVSD